jgi:RNA polymerase sigma-70 factor (ECF subfamily)
MDLDFPGPHLSRISTPWTLVRQAHAGSAAEAVTAQRLLIQRYCGAVYRYLRGALHDDEEALELFQEFVLRFLRGDFRRADAEVGRFRDYLRTALAHLITDHHRQRRRWPQPLPADLAAPAQRTEPDDEAIFLQSWREELINRAWEALAEANPNYHLVLVTHVEHPEMTSSEAGEQLTARFGKPITAAHVRVTLHRARRKFGALLLDEVAHSLGACTEAELVEELETLRLLKLCGPAMKRSKAAGTAKASEPEA